MKSLWYFFLHWLCVRIYFERSTILHAGRLPRTGPTLYIALHRNGAVDGFVYHKAIPQVVFLISTQLRRSFLARLFFCGIAVARKNDDADRSRNAAALDQCHELLAANGALVIFPEGTSSLGPAHLPFKSGAASIAVDALTKGLPLRILPLGIHYERAWAFRSKVEVVVGESLDTSFSPGLSDLGRLKEMKRRMHAALETVGVNFPSVDAQEKGERLAYAATLGTPHTYFDSLKVFEPGVPGDLDEKWRELEPRLRSDGVLQHQRVPLFPTGSLAGYALLLSVTGPVMLAGAALNFPPLLAGWLAARCFADERNVIALWRILAGLPVFLIWFPCMIVATGLSAGWQWAAGYVLLTAAALKLHYRVKKLAVAVWNGMRHRDLIQPVHGFHQSVLKTIPTQ